jgi:carbon starvation protein
VATTTSTTAYREITGKFWRIVQGSPPDVAPDPVRGWLNIGLTILVVSCVLVILASAALRWLAPVKSDELASSEVSSELGVRS